MLGEIYALRPVVTLDAVNADARYGYLTEIQLQKQHDRAGQT